MQRDVPEIDVNDARRRQAQGDPLIDVRERSEHEEVRIPGARLLPMSELDTERLQELPRERELMVQCRSGARSAAVTAALIELGYRAVNVSGGILAWESAGLPLERGE